MRIIHAGEFNYRGTFGFGLVIEATPEELIALAEKYGA